MGEQESYRRAVIVGTTLVVTAALLSGLLWSLRIEVRLADAEASTSQSDSWTREPVDEPTEAPNGSAWWALVAVIGASVAITLALKRSYSGEDLLLLASIAYAPVGAVIARRRPDNPIGWLFLIVGLAASLMELARVGEWAALGNGPPLDWWGYVSAWVLTAVAFPLIILSTAFTFLLYPRGWPLDAGGPHCS